MMRGNEVLSAHLFLPLSLLLRAAYRGLTLIELGRKDEGIELELRSGAHKEENLELYAMPLGLLFRPTSSKRLLLVKYQHVTGSGSSNFYHAVSTTPVSPSLSSTRPKSASSSTYIPSLSDRGSIMSQEESRSSSMDKEHEHQHQESSGTKHRSLSKSSSTSASTPRHLRTDLIQVLGPDLIIPTTKISTIPCAGVRIASGNLVGLMGW
ncbi:hypothetical protein F5050DRAFT_1439669 [Lentinula boryana]|uniref:Uncharacterized protein n=1 Tax=Lentinula boryana TaxID=40481 RepID=A0ABQ8QFM1_9AGAR|nr:hypothetical protein F5050DRAFT_1439669 [Lentinula boryana]